MELGSGVGLNGVGWGGMGWCRRWQISCLEYFMSIHDAHTVANDTPVDNIVGGSKPCLIGVFHVCHCTSHGFGGLAICL